MKKLLLTLTLLALLPAVQAFQTPYLPQYKNPSVESTLDDYVYTTTHGTYVFHKDSGAYRYVYVNGSTLCPSAGFILQYDHNDSWEDLSLEQPEFVEVKPELLQYRQMVFNGSASKGYTVTTVQFSRETPPKLSIDYDLLSSVDYAFRVVFKVTVPQAWTYFIDDNTVKEIPRTRGLTLTRKRVEVVSSPDSDLCLIVDWEDFGETDVELRGSTVTVVFPENVSDIDPTTFGSSTSNKATAYSCQRKTFYAQGRYWVFFSNGSHVLYRTYNLTSWTSAVVVTPVTTGEEFSTWNNSTHVHYVASYSSNLRYRLGALQTDGSIVWADSEQTVGAVSAEGWATVTTDSSGYPYVAFKNSSLPYVTKNDWLNGSWSTASGYPLQLRATDAGDWYTSIVPLTSQKLYVMYSQFGYTLKGRLYNGTGWEAEEEATSTVGGWAGGFHNVVSDSDDVHLVFYGRSTYDIRYVARTGGSWSSETVLSTSTASLHCNPCLTKDGGNLWVFWTEGTATIKARAKLGGTWYDGHSWLTESNLLIWSLNSFYERSSETLALIWTAGASSPYSVRFQQFSYTGTAGAYTVDNTGHVFPVISASWEATEYELSFTTTGNVTITGGSENPLTITDDDDAVSWDYSLTTGNITLTNIDGLIRVRWSSGFPTPRGSTTPSEEEKPVIVPVKPPTIPSQGVLVLVGAVGVVTVAGVVTTSRKKRLNRKPRGSVNIRSKGRRPMRDGYAKTPRGIDGRYKRRG